MGAARKENEQLGVINSKIKYSGRYGGKDLIPVLIVIRGGIVYCTVTPDIAKGKVPDVLNNGLTELDDLPDLTLWPRARKFEQGSIGRDIDGCIAVVMTHERISNFP